MAGGIVRAARPPSRRATRTHQPCTPALRKLASGGQSRSLSSRPCVPRGGVAFFTLLAFLPGRQVGGPFSFQARQECCDSTARQPAPTRPPALPPSPAACPPYRPCRATGRGLSRSGAPRLALALCPPQRASRLGAASREYSCANSHNWSHSAAELQRARLSAACRGRCSLACPWRKP